MQCYIVLSRLACFAFSAASFALAAATPSSDLYTFIVALKSVLLTQMGWTGMRILYQATCYSLGVLVLDSILPILLGDAVVMLATFGASISGVACSLYLDDLMLCQGTRPNACTMYLASSVLGLVAALFTAATTFRLFWARASLHHEE